MLRTVIFATFIGLCRPDFGSAQTFTARIDRVRIAQGPLSGAYLQNPRAAGFRWYFTTIGVHAVALDQKHDRHVRDYLERYLNAAKLPGGAVDDVHDGRGNVEWKVSDSDDAYAGGIISLASWYAGRPGGETWFRTRLAKLKLIASANLVETIDPTTKLTSTFNSRPNRFQVRGVEKAPYQQVWQLMDACEAYRGLKDFADRLAKLGDPDAHVYQAGARTVAQGIAAAFDPMTKSFRVSSLPASPRFYPSRLIQAAPEVYGVDLGVNTKAMYDAAWVYLNAGGDQWWEFSIADGSNQGAPFMILAYAAALRGDRDKATRQLQLFEQALAKPETRPEFGDIQELGWAIRASGLLNERQLK
jgi:hypothetical protein